VYIFVGKAATQTVLMPLLYIIKAVTKKIKNGMEEFYFLR